MPSSITIPGLDATRLAGLLARLPLGLTVVLGLVVGLQGAFLVADLTGGARPADDAAAAGLANLTLPARSPLDISALVAANLFGAEAADPQAAAAATSLPLVLAGVLANSDPARGVALVGESAAAARVFRVGDTLPGGARLQAVLADRILLERGGRSEALMLPRQSSGGTAPPPVAGAPVRGGATAEQAIQQARARMMQAGNSVVGDIIRPQAVLADGRQQGYRVYPGANPSAFGRLGLRPGDLVTAVNGTPLDDPTQSATIFGTLGDGGSARLTVMRNGRQQELTLNLAEVASATATPPAGTPMARPSPDPEPPATPDAE
jgi:general secretion pathway protein C